MNNERSRVRIFVICCALVFIGFVVFVIYNYLHINYTEKVKVINIDKCASGIQKETKETVFANLYQYVLYQNELTDRITQPTYEGVVRSDTCFVKDNLNAKDRIVSTSVDFILDISELEYSYRVKFNYIKPGSDRSEYVDLGSTQVSCLRDEEMIYPGFKCDENELILGVNGSAIDWEIFSAAPYVGDGFTITYTLSPESVSGYSIVLKYTPPESVFKNGTLDSYLAERRKIAEDYLKSKGVNLDEYSIIESKKYW